jgi:hypothetical protein
MMFADELYDLRKKVEALESRLNSEVDVEATAWASLERAVAEVREMLSMAVMRGQPETTALEWAEYQSRVFAFARRVKKGAEDGVVDRDGHNAAVGKPAAVDTARTGGAIRNEATTPVTEDAERERVPVLHKYCPVCYHPLTCSHCDKPVTEDAERLDWLEARLLEIAREWYHNTEGGLEIRVLEDEGAFDIQCQGEHWKQGYPTIRAAIDAAMQSEPADEPEQDTPQKTRWIEGWKTPDDTAINHLCWAYSLSKDQAEQAHDAIRDLLVSIRDKPADDLTEAVKGVPVRRELDAKPAAECSVCRRHLTVEGVCMHCGGDPKNATDTLASCHTIDWREKSNEAQDALAVSQEGDRQMAEELNEALEKLQYAWDERGRAWADRDKLSSQYQQLISAVLECDPIPAKDRPDDVLEPPWDVIRRVKRERDEARYDASEWRKAAERRLKSLDDLTIVDAKKWDKIQDLKCKLADEQKLHSAKQELVNSLEDRVTVLERELGVVQDKRDALRKQLAEADALNERTVCVYCGESFVRDEQGCLDAIQAHIRTCSTHSMRGVEAALAEERALHSAKQELLNAAEERVFVLEREVDAYRRLPTSTIEARKAASKAQRATELEHRALDKAREAQKVAEEREQAVVIGARNISKCLQRAEAALKKEGTEHAIAMLDLQADRDLLEGEVRMLTAAVGDAHGQIKRMAAHYREMAEWVRVQGCINDDGEPGEFGKCDDPKRFPCKERKRHEGGK